MTMTSNWVSTLTFLPQLTPTIHDTGTSSDKQYRFFLNFENPWLKVPPLTHKIML